MRRKKIMPKKERLQFDFSKDQIAALDQMQEATNASSRTEVLHKALKLADFVAGIESEQTVEITDKQGQIVFRGPAKLLK